MIKKEYAQVVSVAPLSAPRHFVLTMKSAQLASSARPGHFIAVAADTGAAILRKPFSVFTVDKAAGEISILFSVYGPTTTAMSRMLPGDFIDVLGPLGGRIFDPEPINGIHHILVGGGYGVPPLNYLAKSIRAGAPAAVVTVIIGARTENLLVGDDGLSEAGVEVIYCTDDGTTGVHGRVTDALLPLLKPDARVYTCGPTPMMRAVGELSEANGIDCQVSLETFMPCGVGICVGCVVKKRDGVFSRTCTDGPVYPGCEVAW
ncbi:MAG: dihydroorotate dehydrogenase electron transfer subunit [Armatimonadota bacterium]